MRGEPIILCALVLSLGLALGCPTRLNPMLEDVDAAPVDADDDELDDPIDDPNDDPSDDPNDEQTCSGSLEWCGEEVGCVNLTNNDSHCGSCDVACDTEIEGCSCSPNPREDVGCWIEGTWESCEL